MSRLLGFCLFLFLFFFFFFAIQIQRTLHDIMISLTLDGQACIIRYGIVILAEQQDE